MSRRDFYQYFVDLEQCRFGAIIDELVFGQDFTPGHTTDFIYCNDTPLYIHTGKVPLLPKVEPPMVEGIFKTDINNHGSELATYTGHDLGCNKDSLYTRQTGKLIEFCLIISPDMALLSKLILGKKSVANRIYLIYIDNIPYNLICINDHILLCFSWHYKKQYIICLDKFRDKYNPIVVLCNNYIAVLHEGKYILILNMSIIIKRMDGLIDSGVYGEGARYRKKHWDTYDKYYDMEEHRMSPTSVCDLMKHGKTYLEWRISIENISDLLCCARDFGRFCTKKLSVALSELGIPRVFAQTVGKYLTYFS